MEKFVKHYDLAVLISLFEDEETRDITSSSYAGAVELGYSEAHEIIDVVKKIEQTDFCKSMTSIKKPGLWQDVYKMRFEGKKLYIKLQLGATGKAVLVSFKKDTDR